MENDNVRLLTLEQAARLLGVKESTLRSWRLHRKNLPFVTVGRCVRVSVAAVENLISSNTIPAREPRR